MESISLFSTGSSFCCAWPFPLKRVCILFYEADARVGLAYASIVLFSLFNVRTFDKFFIEFVAACAPPPARPYDVNYLPMLLTLGAPPANLLAGSRSLDKLLAPEDAAPGLERP